MGGASADPPGGGEPTRRHKAARRSSKKPSFTDVPWVEGSLVDHVIRSTSPSTSLEPAAETPEHGGELPPAVVCRPGTYLSLPGRSRWPCRGSSSSSPGSPGEVGRAGPSRLPEQVLQDDKRGTLLHGSQHREDLQQLLKELFQGEDGPLAVTVEHSKVKGLLTTRL